MKIRLAVAVSAALLVGAYVPTSLRSVHNRRTILCRSTEEPIVTLLPPNQEPLRNSVEEEEYQRGIVTIAGITLFFASNAPAVHAVFSSTDGSPPPVLLLNCGTSVVALLGLLWGGPLLSSFSEPPSTLVIAEDEAAVARDSIVAGAELGAWKFLATTTNIYGLSLTSASHGAFLVQLTTLLVPLAQGISGVPIPRRIWGAIALALLGVGLFTADPSSTGSTPQGDELCVLAAVLYAAYDLRLFKWGSRVSPLQLITNKIATQALLSILLLLFSGFLTPGGALSPLQESLTYVEGIISPNLEIDGASSGSHFFFVALVVVWSGVVVNAIASFLQVGGQQAIGPARAQVIYASQPLWAAIMAVLFLHESVGLEGVFGGAAFLVAMFLAATAEPPDPNCEEAQCEI